MNYHDRRNYCAYPGCYGKLGKGETYYCGDHVIWPQPVDGK